MLNKLRDNAKIINDINIINILNDDKCFFKLNIDEAFYILRKLKVKETKILSTYLSLISIENYRGNI